MLSTETAHQAQAMLADGASHFEVARDLRIPLTSVAWIESGRHPRLRAPVVRVEPEPPKVKPKRRRKPKPRKPAKVRRPRYLPTAEQINAECARFRESAPRALA